MIAESVEECKQQMAEFGEMKRRMEEKQNAVEQLSTFVAVVDQQTTAQQQQQQQLSVEVKSSEGSSAGETHLLQLEALVKQVGHRKNQITVINLTYCMHVVKVTKRWQKLNDRIEQRIKMLGETIRLVELYERTSEQLNKWLDMRCDELKKLGSVNSLESGEQVQEQLNLLRSMEQAR